MQASNAEKLDILVSVSSREKMIGRGNFPLPPVNEALLMGFVEGKTLAFTATSALDGMLPNLPFVVCTLGET